MFRNLDVFGEFIEDRFSKPFCDLVVDAIDAYLRSDSDMDSVERVALLVALFSTDYELRYSLEESLLDNINISFNFGGN